MRNGGGILRLAGIFALSLALIFYNAYTLCAGYGAALTDTHAQNTQSAPTVQSTSSAPSAENAAQPTADEPKTAPSAAETVAAAASGNVKGKVISNYISPYKASLSYGGVYVKNSTDLSINVKEQLEAPLKFKIKKSSEPQVLIMHTHTTETYMTDDTGVYTDAFSSRTRDETKNMVSVGSIVAEKIKAAGFGVIHDKTEHDYPKYTGSYTRAAKTITGYLKKYPSIKIVLDLHRDAVSSGDSDKVKLVTEINGKKAAQVMLVMGSQSGSVTNFPNWQENFRLALKLQQKIEKNYPTLARPVSLMPKNYNESLTTGSLLIEFGTDANTVAEAHYSAEMVGSSLAELLNELC